MTSIDYSIQFSLGFKDSNLIFQDSFYQFIHTVKYRVFEFKLRYDGDYCPICHQATLVKYGYSTVNTKFTTDDASHPILLRINKQRVQCKSCHKTQMAQTSVVRKHYHIANKVKSKVIMSLQDDRTIDCIARDNNVSTSTVNRYLDQSRSIAPIHQRYLPNHLAMDEFRGVNHQLHFICIDNQKHDILTILPDRFKQTIEQYFLGFSLNERAKVQTVSMDLNSYYQDIVKRLLPNAQIIIDRFHIVAMLTRAFNQYRAKVMKQFDKHSREYRLLKFNWRLYLAAEDRLSYRHEYYDRHLRQKVTSATCVDLGLGLDEQLANDYHLMQNVMADLRHHDMDNLVISLYSTERLSPQMNVIVKTLKANLEYVLNAAQFNFSNGPLEGLNRMIKQIERTAFGFRNFNHLVYRIYYRRMAKKNQTL